MRLYHVLVAVPIAILAITMTLLIQVEKEHALEVHSEFVYYETLVAYNERVLNHAVDLIERYEIIIRYQRHLIGKMGQSPCVERAWLLLR